MSAFQNALKNYKAGTPSAPPVNPPEAVRVLEEQSAPEVANTAPKAIAPATSAVTSAVAAPEPAKRTRRSKAEMEAARASAALAVSPNTGTPAPSASESGAARVTDGGFDLSELTTEDLTAELARRGYSGTLGF